MIIDQVTKGMSAAENIRENAGFIFGLASDLPSSLRVIGLSSVFGFLFFLYLILIYFLPTQLFKLKLGLSFLAGGIFGNVVDRVARGVSIDFIPLPLFGYDITFNLADAFQWVGAGLIVFNVIVHEKIIWYPDNQRGKVLIHPKEQIRFALKITGTVLCSSFLLGLFAMTFLKYSLMAAGAHSDQTQWFFFLSYLSLTLLFSIFVFAAGLFFSHKTAGPFYAFEQYVEELLEGTDREFILREGDHYKHLEHIAQKLKNFLKD